MIADMYIVIYGGATAIQRHCFFEWLEFFFGTGECVVQLQHSCAQFSTPRS